MSAKYTRLGQLKGKFGVPEREYLTARDFGGNFYLRKYVTMDSQSLTMDSQSLAGSTTFVSKISTKILA